MQTVHVRRIPVWSSLLFAILTLLLLTYTPSNDQRKQFANSCEDINSMGSIPLWAQTLDFNKLNFSNETGNPTGCYLVPNYIHFIHFGGEPITYIQLICILAAYKNQNPDKIYFHYDNKTIFTGKYWKVLEKMPRFMDIVLFYEVTLPHEIFGQPLSTVWRKWHGSDVMRLQVMMKYGGIYLDNDSYIVKSIDNYRRFEISISWAEEQIIMPGAIVAHKDARFLKKWLDTYKEYDETMWMYNIGEKPTHEILFSQPELVHRVRVLFGMDNRFVYNLFTQDWIGWKRLYILHTYSRHTHLVKNLTEKATYPVDFNETNIAYYPITFRQMAYEVYDIANIQWPKNKFD